jgi:2,3-bisphosphoglycerate-independent phosphoglycerate mutase
MNLDFMQRLAEPAESKILLFVMDGLGGLPKEQNGLTALEAAETPNLDRLAAESVCGLHLPIASGITSGSGPSHLALFGYDPIKYQIGRGTLSALGIDFDLQRGDVAARGNFCTLDEDGRVADRRAGRIPTEKNRELCKLLREIELPGVDVFVETVKEYRLLLVLRGEGLSGDLDDTDPQDIGEKPQEPKPRSDSEQAEKTSELVKEFLEQARQILGGHDPANMILLRGFSQLPDWPSFEQAYKLRAAAIAAYPMYRGVAKLVGMDVLETGKTLDAEVETLEKRWDDYDYYFLHFKPIDSAGEDGDFDRKVSLIEEADAVIPRLRALDPDVMIVTGDHSSPALLKYHSWHPLPVLLWSPHCRADEVRRFGERACLNGGLGGRIPAVELMPLAMANALRLEKFGA